MKQYDHGKIEKKWQKYWEQKKLYRADDKLAMGKGKASKKFYALVEFPFPSGAGLHTGHTRSYTAMDVVSRMKRAKGYNVLFPIGWDAFGLPTENYAIKTGIPPQKATKQNTDTFRRQLKSVGISFDWSREVNTTDPAYYKWTQWIFLQMYKKGLAYKSRMSINWCPKDKIGLANEEVIDGKCERCGTTVEKREKEQWMLAITKYADRLDKDLDDVDYQERIKIQQRNWIGRSEGVNITNKVKDLDITYEVYDSIPQTAFAQTFGIIAPEHPLVKELVAGTPQEKEVLAFAKSVIDKKAKDKFNVDIDLEGVFTGRYIENYLGTGRDLPIWVASYALYEYGTGAVNCSAHDERDFAFAKKYGIPLRAVLVPKDADEARKAAIMSCDEFYRMPDGVLVEPSQFAGRTWEDVRKDMIDFLVDKGYASRKVNYKLRDWIFSRQRYWGEPIPMISCDSCGWQPVPEKDLPVKLPPVKKYEPSDNGESPLAAISSWVNTKCPKCKGKAKRETDTMPNWAGSSWYYLRYADPKNKKALADMKKLEAWMPVDWYNGGMEHTTLHLLYSRFWHKFLHDIGVVTTSEPYAKRTSHGLILAEGGAKMSKSVGNVVNPDDLVKLYGADTLRVYQLFMGPFGQAIAWNTSSMIGSRRFVERVYSMAEKVALSKKKVEDYSPDEELNALINKTIKKVGEDIEDMGFNTAVSSLMILVNALEKAESVPQAAYEALLKLLAPFAPHVTDELWSILGHKTSIHLEAWPEFDTAKLQSSVFKIVVQINSKVRATFETSSEVEAEVLEKALSLPEIQAKLGESKPERHFYVKGKLINLVVPGA